MESKDCYLALMKNGEFYLFKYLSGNEKNLFFALLEIGRDDNHVLNLTEIFFTIKKISNHLQKHGIGKNLAFEWPKTEENRLDTVKEPRLIREKGLQIIWKDFLKSKKAS